MQHGEIQVSTPIEVLSPPENIIERLLTKLHIHGFHTDIAGYKLLHDILALLELYQKHQFCPCYSELFTCFRTPAHNQFLLILLHIKCSSVDQYVNVSVI